MNRWIRIPDGSTWPRPTLDTDDALGAEWAARHAPDTVTREDLLWLTSVAHAYGHLLVESTQARRDQVCREIRAALNGEVDQ